MTGPRVVRLPGGKMIVSHHHRWPDRSGWLRFLILAVVLKQLALETGLGEARRHQHHHLVQLEGTSFSGNLKLKDESVEHEPSSSSSPGDSRRTFERLSKRRSSSSNYPNDLETAKRMSAMSMKKQSLIDPSARSQQQPPNELLFSNQTGAVAQCGVALELAKGIAAAAALTETLDQRPPTSFYQQQPEVAAQQLVSLTHDIQIRWEKENGEEVEPTVFGGSSMDGSLLADPQQPTGSLARQAPLLRSVRHGDGALVFEPFRAADYRPDIHSSSYRCVASSRGGSLVSRDMQVRAVLSQQPLMGPQVEVNDELVIEGNSVQFKCKIPSYAQEYLQVIEWIEYPSETVLTYQSTSQQNANHLFRPVNYQQQQQQQQISSQHVHNKRQEQSSNLTTRYFISPKLGDLHILNADPSLQYRSFRCRCKNKLTGELVSSVNKGKLVVTESRDAVAPRLILDSGSRPNVVYEEGELAMLACNVQSYPRAQLTWLRRINDLDSEPVMVGGSGGRSRYAQVANLLLINRVNRNDSGAYLCQVKNSIGEERLEFELQVRAPLRAKLSASATVLELGKSLALDCTVSGYPIHQVVFRHNRNIIKSISGAMAAGVQHPQSQSQATYHGQDQREYNNDDHRGRPSPQHQPQATGSYFVIEAGNEPPSLGGLDGGQQLSNEASEASVADEQSKLSHVIVIVLEPQHAGAYQCFAYNQYESVQSSAYIRVLDDPPKFKDTFKSEIFEQRQDVSLQCSARANPLPEITWSIDEQPLPDLAASDAARTGRIRFGDFVTKDNLVISYVNISGTQVTDSGLYRCTADNGLAQVSHQAQISVVGGLQVKPMPNMTVVASTTFRIRCPVAGWPVGDVQWQHQGRRLPANHRQHVYENGTLEVEHMEKSQGDDGEYTCQASSGGPAAASQATGSVQVSIKVRPTIEPFAVSRWLREGQRASITCTISSGDLPISIVWFRNEQPLEAGAGGILEPQVAVASGAAASATAAQLPGVRISRGSDYSSTLLFESLLVEHSGNYTCVARNDAGSVSHQAPMIVQVAPKWSLEPGDTNVIRGSSMSIDCMASGFPPPRIIWTKAGPDSASSSSSSSAVSSATNQAQRDPKFYHPNSWRSIVSSPHLQVYENGSLNILDARDSDLGYYMCQASNGVGPGLSKVIRVTVNVAAQFSSRHSVQYVIRGEQAQLKCQAKGDWPLLVQWFKNKSRLEQINLQDAGSQNQLVGQQQQQSVALLSSTLASVLLMPHSTGPALGQVGLHGNSLMEQLSSLAASSAADLAGVAQQTNKPSASNGHLMDRYSMANSLLALTRDHPMLAARAGQAPYGPLLELQQLNGSSSSKLLHQPLVVQWNSMLAIGLADRQDTGIFKCLTTNYFGTDERTIQLIVQEAPDRVEGLAVSEVSSRSVSLAWSSPYDGNTPITSYHIQYRPAATSGADFSSSSDSLLATTSGWSNYTLNTSNQANYSTVGSLELLFDYQQQQQQQHEQATTSSRHLQVVAPAGNGRSQVRLTIASLRPVTRYWLRVSAENKLGLGPVSAPVEALTLEETPGAAPTKLKAVAQSSSSILVSWSRPVEKESFGSIHGYYVAYRVADQAETSGSGPGTSSGLLELEAMKQQKQTSGASTAALSSPPPAATSSSTSSPNIYKTIAHDDKVSKFDALLTSLKRSTRYVISVQAFNARGVGPSSEPLLVKTLDMDPPRQVKLFVKQASNCSIQLEWRPLSQTALLQMQLLQQKPPGDQALGGEGSTNKLHLLPLAMPLNSGIQPQVDEKSNSAKSSSGPMQADVDVVDHYSLYQAELNERPHWQEIRLPGHASSHLIENLNCGTRYQFYMMGVNKIGVGDQSDILDTKTAGGLPLASDRQSSFDVINTTCYVVRLDRWQDNGCPIRELSIKYRPETGARDWIHLAHFDLFPSSAAAVAAASSAATVDEDPSAGEKRVGHLAHHNSKFSTGRAMAGRTKRSSIGEPSVEDQNDAYLSGMTDMESGEEDAFFEYGSNEQLGVAGGEIGDYLAEPFNIDSAPGNLSQRLTSLSQLPEPSKQLFSLLKDSMQSPTFEQAPLSQSHLSPATSVASHHQLPSAHAEWQASNFMADQVEPGGVAGDSPKLLARKDVSGLLANGGMSSSGRNPNQDWRRVRLCNLLENLYYTVQVSASNSVGETEAEYRLLTSPEGLEFDQEIKRQVVGRLGADRSAQQVAVSDRLSLFALDQWPVLVPITLTITLMTVIIVGAFLLKRSHAPGSTSTTTTTTTRTASGGHCHHAGGLPHFKGGPASAITEATLSSDMMLGAGMDNYTLAGGNFEAERGDNNGTMPIYQQHQHNGTLHHQATLQHRSNQSVFGEESAYGVVGGFNHAYNGGGANETNRSSGSPATTTAATSSLTSGSTGHNPTAQQQQQFNHAAMLLRSAESMAAQQQQQHDQNTRGRSVYLCSAAPKSDLSGGKQEAIFYGVAQQANPNQPQNPIYGHPNQAVQVRQYQQESSNNKDLTLAGSSTFLPGQAYHNNGLYGGTTGQPQQLDGMQVVDENSKLENCFLNLVEEVARANESLGQQRAANGPPLGMTGHGSMKNLAAHQDGATRLDQALPCDIQASGCFNQTPLSANDQSGDGTNYASVGQMHLAQDAALHAESQLFKQQTGVGNQTTNRLMFDPVYATIRRTFPQAFRYLTLQQNHGHGEQHQQSQYQQQQQQQGPNSFQDPRLASLASQQASGQSQRQSLCQTSAHDMTLFSSSNLAALNLLTPTATSIMQQQQQQQYQQQSIANEKH